MRISNKIGLGIGGRGAQVRLVSPSGIAPRAVKLLDPSPEYVAQIREEVGPKTLIVVRYARSHQPLSEPAKNAWMWYTSTFRRGLDLRNYGPIAYEGYNEVPRSQLESYVAFEIERVRLLHACGASAVVGNWGVGIPEPEDWARIAPLVEALRPGDYVGLHEYGGILRHVTDPHSALVCRFTHPQAWRVLRGVPILITEFGADEISTYPPEEQGAPGWKRLGISAREYAETWVQAFSDRYEAIENVFAALAFGAGNFGFGTFDHTEVWPHVTANYYETGVITREPLPEDEKGELPHLLTKAVWWSEELSRQLEANRVGRAMEIGYSLTTLLQRIQGRA